MKCDANNCHTYTQPAVAYADCRCVSAGDSTVQSEDREAGAQFKLSMWKGRLFRWERSPAWAALLLVTCFVSTTPFTSHHGCDDYNHDVQIACHNFIVHPGQSKKVTRSDLVVGLYFLMFSPKNIYCSNLILNPGCLTNCMFTLRSLDGANRATFKAILLIPSVRATKLTTSLTPSERVHLLHEKSHTLTLSTM